MELIGQSACETTSVPCAEEELVAEARFGSLAAFQRLGECYETRVFQLAHRITHCREDAEEIMQDAFVKAFKNVPRLRGDSGFSTWLGRITINESLMKMLRRRVKEISVDHPVETDEGIFT